MSLVALTVVVALIPAGLAAQEVGQTKEVAPGISVKNLAEVPTDVPGYDKVRIVELTMQPGASLPSGTKMDKPMFCTVLKGRMTFKVDGVDTTYGAGDSYVCRVGQTFEGRNTGSEPYVERMHQLIPAGQR
jgi:mannose-6-phosphate isomerase-like protein (cupin superfamily)